MSELAPQASQERVAGLPAGKSRLEIAWWSLVFVAAAVIAAAYIFYTIFSLFQAYDDEGFILLSLKSFFQGKPLYDAVYSSFQPAFYVLYWVFFTVLGVPLSHDSIRIVTLMLWLAGAALNGAITYRLTSSALLALLVSVVSVRCMEPFANEPGHPEALAYVLIATIVLLFSFADAIPPRRFAVVLGTLVALVVLIKVNIGLFVLLPAALLFVSGKEGKITSSLKLGLGILMLGLPVFLWRLQLAAKDTPWGNLGLEELLALVLLIARLIRWRGLVPLAALAVIGCMIGLFEMNSVSVAALPVYSAGLLSLSICGALMICLERPRETGYRNFELRGIEWACAAFAAVAGSIILVTVLRGTTLHGLLDGFILWPAKVSTSFLIRLRSNWLGACLGVAGATACHAYLGLRGRWGNRTWFRAAMIIGQVSFGLAVLVEFYLRVQGSRTLMPLQNDLPHFWMLPFAWLVAAPETGLEKNQFARQALLLITVMQPLIAIPVAGTQLVPASILIAVLGAVCLADGLRACLRVAPKISEAFPVRLAVGMLGAAVLLVSFGQEMAARARIYASLTPLDLPGAKRIRLTSDEVRLYHEIVDDLARSEVETFLTLPGLDSFYLWAKKEPPNGLNVSAWVVLLDNEAQERVWQAAQSRRGLVVLRNRRLIRSWVGGRSIAQLPLVRHIEENFKPERTYGSYELMVRR